MLKQTGISAALLTCFSKYLNLYVIYECGEGTCGKRLTHISMPAVTGLNHAAQCLVSALFLHLSLHLFPKYDCVKEEREKYHILHLPANVLGDFGHSCAPLS